MLLRAEVKDGKELQAQVLSCFDAIPAETMNNLVNANRAYIEGMLQNKAKADRAQADLR